MTGQRHRRLVVPVAVLLAAVALGACRSSSRPVVARLTVDGQADVSQPGEDRTQVTGSRGLRVDDRIRVRQGTAEIRLGDQHIELRQGSDVELRAAGSRSRTTPELMGGDLLVTSGTGPFALRAPGVDVSVSGTARVSRGVALLVATYKGFVTMDADGRSLTVPALRQAAVQATGGLPPRVTPLEYSVTDLWDQRYLSDAIELGNQLASRSQGFSAQVGDDARSVKAFRSLFPQLAAEPSFDAPLFNASRPPGESLVGAAITLAGTNGTFSSRWAAVFAFRDDGASWGLVALDQGVDRVGVLDSVQAAIARGPTTFAAGSPGSGPGTLPPPSGGAATTTTTTVPRSTVTTRPAGGAGGSTTTTTRPPSSPTTTTPTGPVNTGSPVIDDTVNSLVDTLTGLLRSLGGQ
ncbi:MAG TPA: hypothetical protein VL337_12100 [Acidimicrobiales bacterium]|nr:hypothetical protein [Acidimicrobiales bacterium]